jgi:hypothetical protein
VTTEEELALATAAITVAERAWAAYRDAKAGTVSVSAALAHISAMLEALPGAFAEDDARADQAVDEKFK